MSRIQELAISKDRTLLEALKLMDKIDKKLLLVMDSNIFIGLISIGDIQRAIINSKDLESSIQDVLRPNIKVASDNHSREDIKKMMIDFRMEFCPVVRADCTIDKIYFWDEIVSDNFNFFKSKFSLPVVIMAGGKGTRLKPITNVLPKPLVPLNEKTMLEEIFDKFYVYGCKNFFVSVNYKSDLIEYYINQQKLPFDISFFKEDKPLGTAGSLSLLKGKINSTFFVSNCDILIDQDYSEVLDFHNAGQFEVTIFGALKHYSIPYGTLETGSNGELISLKEKPDQTILTNSGMYILQPHLIDEIPAGEFFHITHLIEQVLRRNGRVGVFPVSEKSWRDMGAWDEFFTNMTN